MIPFARRNIKIFFRDKANVFFSLLGALIIIGLYALFLGDIMVQMLDGVEGGRVIIGSWIVAGILAVTSVTGTLGAFGNMINDKDKKIVKDFYVSPMNRQDIAGGYVLSSFSVGLILTMITMVVGFIYIVSEGGNVPGFVTLAKAVGIIHLCSFSNTAVILFLVSFLNSEGAFAAASTIIGTVIGFLTGIYVNIGSLPAAVQTVVKVFPPSHGATLLRQILMEEPMDKGFADAPAEFAEEFNKSMGIVLDFNGKEVEPWMSVGILLVTGVIFFMLGIWRMSMKRS